MNQKQKEKSDHSLPNTYIVDFKISEQWMRNTCTVYVNEISPYSNSNYLCSIVSMVQ